MIVLIIRFPPDFRQGLPTKDLYCGVLVRFGGDWQAVCENALREVYPPSPQARCINVLEMLKRV